MLNRCSGGFSGQDGRYGLILVSSPVDPSRYPQEHVAVFLTVFDGEMADRFVADDFHEPQEILLQARSNIGTSFARLFLDVQLDQPAHGDLFWFHPWGWMDYRCRSRSGDDLGRLVMIKVACVEFAIPRMPETISGAVRRSVVRR